jgi:hypothetical protein
MACTRRKPGERFNRTLKEALWYHVVEAQTRKWTDVLQDEVAEYNERKHRSIACHGMSPQQARTPQGRRSAAAAVHAAQ